MSDDLQAPDQRPLVRIDSDGTPVGTVISVDDQALQSITQVSWSVRVGTSATAELACEFVPAELIGKLSHVTLSQPDMTKRAQIDWGLRCAGCGNWFEAGDQLDDPVKAERTHNSPACSIAGVPTI